MSKQPVEAVEDDEVIKQAPTYSTFKGKPTISLPLVEGSSFKFTFGLSKAKLILEYLPEIEEFVKKHEDKK